MNLIANSGIQLLTIPFEIDLNNQFKMYFHEWLDITDQQKKIEIAHYFPDAEVWVKKRVLSNLGYAIDGDVKESWETIQEDDDFDTSCIIPIDTEDSKDSGCFDLSVGKIREEDWQKFENHWFPMPFFLRKGNISYFGPTNWCRFKLIPQEINNRKRRYSLLMAFDTKSVLEKEDFEDEDLNESPVFTTKAEKAKEYALCNNEYKLVSYCSDEFNCDWVDHYLLRLFHNVDNIDELKGIKMPKMRYLALFIFLNRFLYKFAGIPSVTLYNDINTCAGNVDLVVDIGNSRTCAILFDNSDFTKSSPLELQDFTTPVTNGHLNKHRDPFDMRLAFRKADFGGKFGIINSHQFTYPSMVRLGKEANNLIHLATNTNTGAEKTSTFSSPKRFLWDSKPQKQEWEFVQLPGETASAIYIEGISEQLNSDGTLNTDGDGGILTRYSRKALMTFAFLEILAQAKMQINSYEQRQYWGYESMPRKIGRIIVTCPTAMSRLEQTALRHCAEDAAIILDRFFGDDYNNECDDQILRKNIQVIPSVKKLISKEEWIYDEATSAQFVFLYAEIKERYKKNVKEYFDFYGKVRDDIEDYSKKSLTIGSVDIGAGTTDVMVAAYKYEDGEQCVLTPVPLFWESFYKAGDDLLKELIHQLVIEGRYSPIEQRILKNGGNPIELMQPFLGTDDGVSFRNRQLRSDFNLQVSVPIVSKYLELLKNNDHDNLSLSYSDIFNDNPPTKDVLEHFYDTFGFRLESIEWHYEKKAVSSIIKKTFDSLIGKISSIFSFYHCDIVLLSGRPTSLEPLSNLFLEYYAISPNRLKSMNDYRVGRWYPEDKRYPFIDGNGKFTNPKSIVTTGAMIGQIASNGGFNGFILDLKELSKDLTPTTNYFGQLDDSLQMGVPFITSETNIAHVNVTSLPFRIGVKQLDIESYPTRPFYTIDFNDFRLEDRVRGRFDDDIDDNTIEQCIKAEKQKIRKGMPLKITLSRNFAEDKETLAIENITDKDGNSIDRNFIALQVQSMAEVEDFWLDSGIFTLNVNHKN